MAALAKPSRSATLLHIIRILIDIGRDRLAAIRSQPDPAESRTIARAFGTFNVALIVARILRGLRLAAALEHRVIAVAHRVDTPPPARAAEPRPPRPQPERPEADDAERLARLATDREIAEMIRRRPIGAVLVDICADLGIGIDHPQWRDLKWIIIDHGGSIESVMVRTFQRSNVMRGLTENGTAPGRLFDPEEQQTRDTTGPPPLLLAA